MYTPNTNTKSVQDMRTQLAAAREAYHRRTAPPTRRVHFAVLVEVMVPTGDGLEGHSTVTFRTKRRNLKL